MKTLFFVGLALATTTTTASAQFGNPGFANPATPGIETGRPTADATNTTDQTFLRVAAVGDQAELEMGNLAATGRRPNL